MRQYDNTSGIANIQKYQSKKEKPRISYSSKASLQLQSISQKKKNLSSDTKYQSKREKPKISYRVSVKKLESVTKYQSKSQKKPKRQTHDT